MHVFPQEIVFQPHKDFFFYLDSQFKVTSIIYDE